MPRIVRRSILFTFVVALVACSQDGRAATEAQSSGTGSGAATGAPLFREAAQGAPKSEDTIATFQGSLAPLIERLKPTVVNISTTTVVKHPPIARGPQGRGRSGPGGPGGPQQMPDEFEEFFERYFGGRPAPGMPEEFRGSSLGSGFVISPDGFILTNYHVVKDASDIVVRFSGDAREYKAEVVGRDPPTDIALIRLVNAPKNIPAATLGDSDALRQGDFVLALGSPFGLRDTATMGIVSAKHRQDVNISGTYDDFIQTDAAINPGNSGGPLFNMRGEVVGINTAIVSPQIGQGVGFAVPINIAKTFLPQLREKGKVTRGYLGVQITDLTRDLAQGFGLSPDQKGALVQGVVPRGPAAKAGIEAGDVVVSLNGKPVDSGGALTRGVALIPPGQKVDLTVLRGAQKRQISFPVAQRPDEEEAIGRAPAPEGEGKGDESPKLGVTLQDLTPEVARELELEKAEGVLVRDVVDGGPASRAGIRRGDLIVEVNRKPVKKTQEVVQTISKMKDGEMALLRVRRGEAAVYVAVPVGGRQ
jgi:serine protease Do